MALWHSHRRLNPESIDEWGVSGIAIVVMVLILVADIATSANVRLHVLYVFPLAAIAFYNPRGWVHLLALGLSFLFQAMTLARYELSQVALFTDITVAASASVLTLVLARMARTNYAKILNQASTDALTRLPNRSAFISAMEAEVVRQRRYGGLFSLAELDLDGFKKLNDTRGHGVGDDALKLLADILRCNTRKSDFAARLGGDEFVVLMPNTQETDCLHFLQQLCRTIEADMASAGFEITASIGVVTFTEPPESIAQALLQADKLMYAAKRCGKGQVVQSEQCTRQSGC